MTSCKYLQVNITIVTAVGPNAMLNSVYKCNTKGCMYCEVVPAELKRLHLKEKIVH